MTESPSGVMGGVASHQTQIEAPILNKPQQQQLPTGAVKKNTFSHQN